MNLFLTGSKKIRMFLAALLLLLTPAKIWAWYSFPLLPFVTHQSLAAYNRQATLHSFYHTLSLGAHGLSEQAYRQALQGYLKLKVAGKIKNDAILTIIDFSQPSIKKRLFVIDIINGKLLFNTYVSHGINSGLAMAERFSNLPESHQSSLGFYVTASTYQGKHGYSMHLMGCEKGINDNAFQRDIVVHGAAYVSESIIRANGYLGRSQGCPALPEKLCRPIINAIKDGSCLFIYSPSSSYLKKSGLV
jgi:hypothetical protein